MQACSRSEVIERRKEKRSAESEQYEQSDQKTFFSVDVELVVQNSHVSCTMQSGCVNEMGCWWILMYAWPIGRPKIWDTSHACGQERY